MHPSALVRRRAWESSAACWWAFRTLCHFLTNSRVYSPSDPILLPNLMLAQTYGLLGRLLEEGNHIHMAVRLFLHFTSLSSHKLSYPPARYVNVGDY